jgi:hypothetical protein
MLYFADLSKEDNPRYTTWRQMGLIVQNLLTRLNIKEFARSWYERNTDHPLLANMGFETQSPLYEICLREGPKDHPLSMRAIVVSPDLEQADKLIVKAIKIIFKEGEPKKESKRWKVDGREELQVALENAVLFIKRSNEFQMTEADREIQDKKSQDSNEENNV